MTNTIPSPDLITRFAAIVGDRNALTDPSGIAPYLIESRGLYKGDTPLVLKPVSVEEVSQILKLASETGVAIVPQGGNTGHVAGQIPRTGAADIVLSLERLNRIRDIDPVGNVIVADAGCILADIQTAAEAHNRLFPLSLGSEGSCRIGGNLSTNAGGTAVLAYGNMRQLCLGLEVVLPTGEIWDGLRRLKKDNTGYDLRDLFIGAEGTLGVITGAVLKLFPQPLGHQVGFAGLRKVGDALSLFDKASSLCGPALTGFELMPRLGVEFTAKHIPGVRDPLDKVHAWYVLIDISTSDSAETAERRWANCWRRRFQTASWKMQWWPPTRPSAGASGTCAKACHRRRSQRAARSSTMSRCRYRASRPSWRRRMRQCMAAIPGARICAFGHMGDGNIHYNISQPVGADKDVFISRWREINAIVHGIVTKYNGSISAEHGIGQLKRDELAEVRSPVEIDLMQRIKHAFDPAGIMNPGKVLKA